MGERLKTYLHKFMEGESQPDLDDAERTSAKERPDDKVANKIGHVYDAKSTNAERIDVLLIQLGYLESPAIGEQTIQQVHEAVTACADTASREEFITRVLLAIKPILEYRQDHPAEAQQAIRRAFVEHGGFTPLNEILSYGRSSHGEYVHIHLAPAEGITNWREQVIDGFRTLATLMREHPEEWEKVQRVTATSWIVAKHPALLEKLGFIIEGPIDEQARKRHFAGDVRPISRAVMNRETLLTKYSG